MGSSAKTDRRSRQGIESRRRILDATLELAHELGYTATSISKVSERSGLPASSVYWHFANKDALFAAVIDESFEGWLAAMPEWTPPLPGEDIGALAAERIRSAVASIATNPHFWRLGLMLSLERQPIEPSARQRFVEIRSRVLDDLTRFWQHALADRGEPHLDEPGLGGRCRLLARFTMATADGLFIAAQTEGDDDLDHLADLLATSVTAAALAG